MQETTPTRFARLAGTVPVSPLFDAAQSVEKPFVHERIGKPTDALRRELGAVAGTPSPAATSRHSEGPAAVNAA